MKIFLLTSIIIFCSIVSHGNEAASAKSFEESSGSASKIQEAPMEEDSISLKLISPICKTNLHTKMTKNSAFPFSFHALKSLFFKQKCDEPEDMKKLSKNEKIFHEILKILLVTLSIGLVAILVSIAGLGMLLFVIPL